MRRRRNRERSGAVGDGVLRGLAYVGGLTIQFWSGLCASPRVLPVVGKRGRWRAAIRQMAAIGVDALPMVAVMSMCAGFILAMQAGAELRRFGALQYVMDTVAIGFTREMGPLLTALVVSGRSGSAFSAEIGTMVVTSEIDALRTMALDPIEFVLAPKYVAAMITVPCLTIMSNAFGILAGAGFMYISTKITLGMYLRYVVNSIVSARCLHRAAEERRVRGHYRQRRVHGRFQNAWGTGCRGAVGDFRRGVVHLSRDPGGRLLHGDLLPGA